MSNGSNINFNIQTTAMILAHLGESVRGYRLNANLSQEELAAKSGLSLSTLKRLESGQGCSLDGFIDVMRSLSRLSDFEFVLPEVKLKPTELLALRKSQKPVRQRASSKKE